MHFRLVGGTEGAFPDGLRPGVLYFSTSDNPVVPLSPSDRSGMPHSTSDQQVLPTSLSRPKRNTLKLNFVLYYLLMWGVVIYVFE